MEQNAQEVIKMRLSEVEGPSTSEFYPGEEKERLRNLKVKVSNLRGFEDYYGYTNIITFTLDNYVFVWMTSKTDLDLTIDDEVLLTGTIKKFDEYNGVKQTHLTRCIIKEIQE